MSPKKVNFSSFLASHEVTSCVYIDFVCILVTLVMFGVNATEQETCFSQHVSLLKLLRNCATTALQHPRMKIQEMQEATARLDDAKDICFCCSSQNFYFV